MNWEDARLFLAVARSGQILAAARRLGVSQAKLSRRLLALEQAVGCKLVIRRSQGCDLTEAGHVLAEKLERVEATFIQAESTLSQVEVSLSGTVRVGAPDGFGAAFLAPRIGQLTQRHPGLRIQLSPVPRSFSLSKREADIAIMVGRPKSNGLIARKLTDYSLSLYASPVYLHTNSEPNTLDELKHHHLIDYVEDLIYSPDLDYSHDVWRGWSANLQITSALAQHEAARGGAGIAILHDYIAKNDPQLKRVIPTCSITRTYWIVHHENLRNIPRIRAVLDFVAEAVASSRSFFLSAVEPTRDA